jgi:hypothetical protein
VAVAAAATAVDHMAAWSRGPLRRLQDAIPGLYVFSNTPISGSDRGDSDTGASPRGGLEASIESLLEQQLNPVAAGGSQAAPAAAAGGAASSSANHLVLAAPVAAATGGEQLSEEPVSPAWGSGVEDGEDQGAASPLASDASDLNLQELMTLLTASSGGEGGRAASPEAQQPAAVAAARDDVMADVTRCNPGDAGSDSQKSLPSTPTKPKAMGINSSSSSSPASRPSPGGASSSSWSPSSSGSDVASSSRRGALAGRDQSGPDSSSNRAPRTPSPAAMSTGSSSSMDVSPEVSEVPLSARWASRRAGGRQEEAAAGGNRGAASWMGSRPVRRWTRYDDEGAR